MWKQKPRLRSKRGAETPSTMRCHLATAVTVQTPTAVNPVDAVFRFLTRPLSDGLMLTDHLIAGAVASAGAVAAMHPLDTLKTLIQKSSTVANTATVGGPELTASSTNALRMLITTLRTKGVAVFYKGLFPNLTSQVPSGAIKFAAYESFIQLSSKLFPDLRGSALVDYTCAALAFVVCSVTLVPGELIKQRLQAGVYPNMVSAFTNIIRNEGPRALYTGYAATLIRDVPYTMLEFGLYAQFKRTFRSFKRRKLTSGEELALGGLAGGCTGFLTTPIDLAKTRLMTQAVGPGRQYSGVLDVLTKVARNEGLPALFKGSVPRVVWLIPFTALYFGIHEAAKRKLLSRRVALQAQLPSRGNSALSTSQMTSTAHKMD